MQWHMYISTRKICKHKPYYCRRSPPHKTPAFNNIYTVLVDIHVCIKNLIMNVQNILLIFHSLVCGFTVQLALDSLLPGYLCDNIGLMLACLPSEST